MEIKKKNCKCSRIMYKAVCVIFTELFSLKSNTHGVNTLLKTMRKGSWSCKVFYRGCVL